MATVKAIAVKDGWNDSPVASGTVTIPSGVGGGVVTLFDYEPHSWSYYSDPNCPIRSLSPADVKITYYGDGIMMNNTSDYTAGTSNYVEPGNANYVGGAKVNVIRPWSVATLRSRLGPSAPAVRPLLLRAAPTPPSPTPSR